VAGLDMSPVLRRLAALSDFRLGLAYAAGIFPSVLLQTWAEAHAGDPWLTFGAGVLALVAVSLLIGVIAFYREDDTFLSGILLAIITGVGTVVSLVVSMAEPRSPAVDARVVSRPTRVHKYWSLLWAPFFS